MVPGYYFSDSFERDGNTINIYIMGIAPTPVGQIIFDAVEKKYEFEPSTVVLSYGYKIYYTPDEIYCSNPSFPEQKSFWYGGLPDMKPGDYAYYIEPPGEGSLFQTEFTHIVIYNNDGPKCIIDLKEINPSFHGDSYKFGKGTGAISATKNTWIKINEKDFLRYKAIFGIFFTLNNPEVISPAYPTGYLGILMYDVTSNTYSFESPHDDLETTQGNQGRYDRYGIQCSTEIPTENPGFQTGNKIIDNTVLLS
ncbi:MAG: hypothetical protein KKF44_05300 [Nanoarchaeota archaeon]|nr:hypothetical protein [Nanoarchaeota archaeon]